jgi:transposase
MAKKSYPDEFKRDAVALYRDTEGATITTIAAELGVSEATLSAWCVTGWAIAEHMRTELVEDALKAADALRGGLAGAVFRRSRIPIHLKGFRDPLPRSRSHPVDGRRRCERG